MGTVFGDKEGVSEKTGGREVLCAASKGQVTLTVTKHLVPTLPSLLITNLPIQSFQPPLKKKGNPHAHPHINSSPNRTKPPTTAMLPPFTRCKPSSPADPPLHAHELVDLPPFPSPSACPFCRTLHSPPSLAGIFPRGLDHVYKACSRCGEAATGGALPARDANPPMAPPPLPLPLPLLLPLAPRRRQSQRRERSAQRSVAPSKRGMRRGHTFISRTARGYGCRCLGARIRRRRCGWCWRGLRQARRRRKMCWG